MDRVRKLFLVLGAVMCLVIGTRIVPASAQQIDRTEVKWLPEIDVANRLSGNTAWFKLAVSLGANQENPLDAI
jgi:hypothetical protein